MTAKQLYEAHLAEIDDLLAKLQARRDAMAETLRTETITWRHMTADNTEAVKHLRAAAHWLGDRSIHPDDL